MAVNMKKITLKFGSALPNDEKAQAVKLNKAYAQTNPEKEPVEYNFVFDASASTFEALEEQAKNLITPKISDQECYAAYQLALSLGVDQAIAYAAYLLCINSN